MYVFLEIATIATIMWCTFGRRYQEWWIVGLIVAASLLTLSLFLVAVLEFTPHQVHVPASRPRI